jgi:hypothetical protein
LPFSKISRDIPQIHRKYMKNHLKNSLGLVGVALAATLGTAGAAQADPSLVVVVPPGLNPGDQYRLVFVTDGTRTATSTDINDYNTFVTNDVTPTSALAIALNAAGLTTTWKAIGSTQTVDARDNTGTNPSSTGVPIYLIDGNLVANNNNDMWDGDILRNIDRTPIDISGLVGYVWTGSTSIGTHKPGFELGSLTTNNGLIGMGKSTLSDVGWIETDSLDHDSRAHLYAMSGVLTAPGAPQPVSVPEPTGVFGYITLGGLMLLGCAIRKARK